MGNTIYALHHYNKYEENNFSHDRYLISYDDIQEDFSGIMKNWFEFNSKSSSIMNLVLYDYFYKGPFDENRFLNIIRALEVFHDHFRRDKIMSKKDFEKEKKTIMDFTPESYKKKIQEVIQFSNKPTLDLRLQELIKEFNDMNIEKKFEDVFITKAKQSRNFYTHFGKKQRYSLEGKELEVLTEDCRTLLTFVILKQLGINAQTLKKIFNNYIPMSHYSRYFL